MQKVKHEIINLIENPLENSILRNSLSFVAENLFKKVKLDPKETTGNNKKIILFKNDIIP